MNGIVTGSLPRQWTVFGPEPFDAPQLEIHSYNDSFHILRQSGFTHFEKPFLYLILGRERALLIDTGAGHVDVAGAVTSILGCRRLDLVVAHSHAHDDHIAGDDQFREREHVTLIPPALHAVESFFGFRNWPRDIATFDLGDRVLDLIAIPGHEATSIAFYDRATSILLSGDTLYPGRLYVEDADAFRASISRLVDFTASRPVAHVLGCHVENSRTPFVDYPVGTVHQPNEHPLELGRANLLEVDDALRGMKGDVVRHALRDCTIWPR